MKPHIALLIASVLASLMVQPDAIAQTRIWRPNPQPGNIAAGSCRMYFGQTNDREELWLHTCSLYSTPKGIGFIYQVDYRQVQAWTDCKDYGWFARNRGYIRATSKATRDMVDFICP